MAAGPSQEPLLGAMVQQSAFARTRPTYACSSPVPPEDLEASSSSVIAPSGTVEVFELIVPQHQMTAAILANPERAQAGQRQGALPSELSQTQAPRRCRFALDAHRSRMIVGATRSAFSMNRSTRPVSGRRDQRGDERKNCDRHRRCVVADRNFCRTRRRALREKSIAATRAQAVAEQDAVGRPRR